MIYSKTKAKWTNVTGKSHNMYGDKVQREQSLSNNVKFAKKSQVSKVYIEKDEAKLVILSLK